jgi:hypothetical protein
MPAQHVRLVSGVVVEPVGDDCVVMTPQNTDVLRLTGDTATLLTRVIAGEPVDHTSDTVTELARLGVVELSNAGMSRRGLITAGAAGAGIAILAMPSVAAASSDPEGPNGALACAPGTEVVFAGWEFDPYLVIYVDWNPDTPVPGIGAGGEDYPGGSLTILFGGKFYESTDAVDYDADVNGTAGVTFYFDKIDPRSEADEAANDAAESWEASFQEACGNFTVGDIVYRIDNFTEYE